MPDDGERIARLLVGDPRQQPRWLSNSASASAHLLSSIAINDIADATDSVPSAAVQALGEVRGTLFALRLQLEQARRMMELVEYRERLRMASLVNDELWFDESIDREIQSAGG